MILVRYFDANLYSEKYSSTKYLNTRKNEASFNRENGAAEQCSMGEAPGGCPWHSEYGMPLQ
jgi:hypothetical protein